MTGDKKPGGLNELIMILSEGIRHDHQIESFATAIQATTLVNWQGDARARWTSLVDVAADRPTMFEALLTEADRHFQKTRFHEKFLQWRADHHPQYPQNSRDDHTRISDAVLEVRKCRSSLLIAHDPRDGKLPLQGMRLAIMEIKELIEGMPVQESSESPIIANAPPEAATAKSEILLACTQTLREVDQLTNDILAARRHTSRSRRVHSPQEALAAEQGIVRLLLNDRVEVDLESQTLLEVIDQQLAHLGIPVPRPGPARQSVQPPPPET